MPPISTYAFTVLTPAAYRTTPWGNGLGETTEIAIDPPGSTVEKEGFVWRVSREPVTKDGPFSRYGDFDRTLLILEGQGMDLYAGGKKLKALRSFDPYPFDGALKVDSRLVDGPVTVFNVITAKKRTRAEVLVHKMNPKTDGWAPFDGDFHLFYGARGSSEAVHNRMGETWRLDEGCALFVRGDGEEGLSQEYLTLRPTTGEAVIIGVGIYLI